jgi:hypothetical protein
LYQNTYILIIQSINLFEMSQQTRTESLDWIPGVWEGGYEWYPEKRYYLNGM